MTQPGETDGLTARRHLEIVRDYAPKLNFDYVIVNDRQISETQAKLYTRDGAEQIGIHGSIDSTEIEGAEVVCADLLDDGYLFRHQTGRLAKAVLERVRGVCLPIQKASRD